MLKVNNMDKQDATRLRVALNFNINHADQGGIDKLLEMAGEHKSTTEMATYFGTSKQMIGRVLAKTLGEKYGNILARAGVNHRGRPKL